MLEVTFPSEGANNFEISLFLYSLVYTSVFLYYCMESTDLQVVTLRDTV